MARRIPSISPRTGRPTLYPWERWMDGSAWRIRRGEDFQIAPKHMASIIRERASKEGLVATARVVGDCVEFEFSQSNDVAA